MQTTWSERAALLVLLALAAWGFSYRLDSTPLLDDPNEGEYAEVAREMVETGDWISPHLNYVLFLNKPPLSYWLIGLSYQTFGVTEFAARLPAALTGVVTVLLLAWLGRLLFDLETGLLAGFVLVASGGFFVETHLVRPDLMVTAGIVGSLVAIAALLRARPSELRWPLIGLQVALAAGLLAKGMLALIVPGCVLAIVVLTERRFDLVARLLHPRGWWLLLLLVVPWHLVMSLKHTGFLWDYVVNQHILFFFDRKFPRDSVPVSLPMFWATFALRLFPWTIFAPLAVVAAGSRARRGEHSRADRFVLAWAGAVLLFFSAASSRMEHYSIPALPAFALLIAKLLRDYVQERTSTLARVLTAHVVVFAALAVSGPFVVPRIVTAQDWLAPIPELSGLARIVFGLLAVGLLLAAIAGLSGRRRWVAPAIIASFAAAIPSFVYGYSLLARVNSSAGMAAALRAMADPAARLIYEAPIEYQNCAGFNFYLRRKLELVRPPDFVPPSYLDPHVDELFISRGELERSWRNDRLYLITDPLAVRSSPDGAVPQPFWIVARDSARWALTNQPLM